jgi:hypothetical protein
MHTFAGKDDIHPWLGHKELQLSSLHHACFFGFETCLSNPCTAWPAVLSDCRASSEYVKFRAP